MKIKKPNITVDAQCVSDLLAVLQEAVAEDDDIKEVEIKNIRLNDIDFCKVGFRSVIFENCKITECDFSRCAFIDVIFKNCDFSNSRFDEGYFRYCEFQSVKWMGCRFPESRLMHVTMTQCNLQYANFDHGAFTYIFAKDCDFSHGILSECTVKEFAVKDSRFMETNFFRTRLRGMDFTECELAGIIVSDSHEELAGAVVSTWQALELARLLGVIIKD